MRTPLLKRIEALVATVLVALVLVAPGFSFGGTNPTAEANCDANIAKQTVQAGGGPKSIFPGPTNCDHFWQTSGAIGP